VVDGDVVAFLSFHATLTANGGAADGMTSTALGTNASGESFVSTDHGASYAVDTSPDPGVIPCFLAGTRLKTPCGPVPAEKLSAGDVVWTVDNGPQRIVWAGQRALRPAETVCGDFFPVCIPKGALGPHSPHRDLYLSPNHRVHLANAAYELLFGSNEALLPARRLVGHNGIHFARDILAPVYVHLLFERHELVVSNGLVSESFHPRPLGLSGFAHETRAELLTLFPDLGQRPDAYGPTTRPCLDRQEAAVALAYLPEAA